MKRLLLLLLVLVLLGSAGAFATENYDSAVAVRIMRANGAAFGQLRAAAGEGDFLSAAGALATLADGSLTLLGYEPPKGSDDEWERIHTGLIAAALQGIIACSQEDADGLQAAVSAMGAYNREGHGDFR